MFQTVQFNHDASLDIVENYDEDSDESTEVNENFLKGEKVEWFLLRGKGQTVDVQFGDGSVCFGIPKDLFTVLNESEDE